MSVARKALGFVGKIKGGFDAVKGIFSAASIIIVYGDRLNDDTDDDGKPQYENILDDIDAIFDKIIGDSKETFVLVMRLVGRINQFAHYVQTGEKNA